MGVSAKTGRIRDLIRFVVARPDISGLPERVREIIQREDRASEILIGAAQLGVAAVLWTLYILAPRPLDAGMDLFAPVPRALALYTAFSVFRMLVILKRPVGGGFIALSILADIGILLGLIWSFHIEYGQTPPFSLKAPTFVYLFVLIVLRSLRFDPRHVLATGLASAAGWGLLTYAAVIQSGPDAVTRSFTQYINGAHILIGAEFDKIFAMLVVTALLTLAALRAQRTLVAAVREQVAAREISRFLSQGVADQISKSQTLIEAGHAVEREAAIMFLDIRGFTPFAASVSPKSVVDMLTSFHMRIIPIVQRHHGVVDKFLGDGVMITFGAVASSASAAADAMRALDAIITEADAWQGALATQGLDVPLHVNAAVASGVVVFAALGGGDRLEYTVIGEAVNLAAKLEKHNKVENSRAVVADATFAAARGQGFEAPAAAYALRTGRVVAGVSNPMDLRVRIA